MKTLNYYTTQNQQLDHLTDQYGAELELLERRQKLILRITLSYYVFGKENHSENYTLQNAYTDSNLEELLVDDYMIFHCLSILEGITIAQAEELQTALLEQCKNGNAKRKTAIDSTYEQLKQLGIPELLARQAAWILANIDGNNQPRTAEQQAIINQVHRIIARGNNDYK